MGRLNWLAVSTHCPCNNKFGREINSLGIGAGVAVGVCVCVCVLFWGEGGKVYSAFLSTDQNSFLQASPVVSTEAPPPQPTSSFGPSGPRAGPRGPQKSSPARNSARFAQNNNSADRFYGPFMCILWVGDDLGALPVSKSLALLVAYNRQCLHCARPKNQTIFGRGRVVLVRYPQRDG